MAEQTPAKHYLGRIGWLRAAVLGANDGVISTASLIVGVAAAAPGRTEVLAAGAAALMAGAMSMAAGEYVSVSSQADVERADLDRERAELDRDPAYELQELADIYTARGVAPDLAMQVARQLTERGALEAHARDELGVSDAVVARPLQAAFASAASFATGAVVPLTAAIALPKAALPAGVATASICALVVLGLTGARLGGAPMWPALARVTFWGAAAMALTAAVGRIFHVAA